MKHIRFAFVVLFIVAVPMTVAFLMSSPVLLPRGMSSTQPPAPSVPTLKPQPAQAVPMLQQPMNVLFLGTDVVYSHSRSQALADMSSYQGNSDSMMFVHLDPQARKAFVLQVPRDTRVDIPGHGTQKINAANPIGGVPLAEQTVGSLLAAPVDHFLLMNVHGIVDLVNELGGVTVEVPKRMRYIDWTAKLNIDLRPGFHTLTGNQAMGFVRYRHDQLGDIGRVQRQQIFMNAVLSKLSNPANWSHLPALLAIAQRNIETDLTPLDILKAAYFLHSLPRQNIQFVMLPGRFADNGDWLVDQSEAQRLVPQLEGMQVAGSDKRQLVIAVENISSDPTLARRVSRELRRRGYYAYVNKARITSQTWHGSQIIAERGNYQDAQTVWNELGQHGSIINASIGDIESNVTVLVNDDMQALFAGNG